jgi:hypothetical protein
MLKKITFVIAVLLSFVCLFATISIACSKPSSDVLIFTSSSNSGHTHEVSINIADINTPPTSGKSITTTSNGGHTHSITLSQQDYQSLQSGNTVNVTSTSVQSHIHTFVLKK